MWILVYISCFKTIQHIESMIIKRRTTRRGDLQTSEAWSASSNDIWLSYVSVRERDNGCEVVSQYLRCHLQEINNWYDDVLYLYHTWECIVKNYVIHHHVVLHGGSRSKIYWHLLLFIP